MEKYQIPVVPICNFEFIFLNVMIYIDNHLIECRVFIKCSYNINSKNQLTDIFEKLKVIEELETIEGYHKGLYYDENTYGDILIWDTVSNKYLQQLDLRYVDENNEVYWFEHYIEFYKIEADSGYDYDID